MTLVCPRCYSEDVDSAARTCRACRIAYDNLQAFEPHTREHTMVAKRWAKWREVDRKANETKRVNAFLGNG